MYVDRLMSKLNADGQIDTASRFIFNKVHLEFMSGNLKAVLLQRQNEPFSREIRKFKNN